MSLTAGIMTRVNSYLSGSQRFSDGTPHHQVVSLLAGGGWVTVWFSDGQDGSSTGVYQQRFNASGQAVGAEMRVNTFTADSQTTPVITGLKNGGWVVSWVSWGGQDGNSAGVYQRVYNAAGNAVTGEIQVNTVTHLAQQNPILVPLENGGFITYWQSQEPDGTPFGSFRTYHRTYSETGTALSGEVATGADIDEQLSRPRTDALKGGGWVAVWNEAGSGVNVRIEAFNAAGSKITSGVVNQYDTNNQNDARVAALDNGGWVVTWTSGGQDGNLGGIYQRAYGANGQPLGGEARVNTTTAGDQHTALVAALDGGGWVVIWRTGQHVGSPSNLIHSQAYNAAGQKVGAETLIASPGTIPSAQVIGLEGGGYVVAWTQSGANSDMMAQVVRANGQKDGAVIHVDAGTDLNAGRAHLVALPDGGFVVSWEGSNAAGTDYDIYQRVFAAKTNTPPTLTADEAGGRGFGPITGNVLTNDRDSDGNPLTVTGIRWEGGSGTVGQPLQGARGTLVIKADGSFVFTPKAGQSTAVGTSLSSLFTYTVSDGEGGTASARLTLRMDGPATGTAGADILIGSAKADLLKGLAGADRLTGHGGRDTLQGGAGNDTLNGGAGDDLLLGGAGADRLIGDAGRDTASYADAAQGVTVSLAAPKANTGIAKGDSFSAIENLLGSSKADKLTGDTKANRLDGGQGNDRVTGGAGNDTLIGGAGRDRLDGGAGPDVLTGGTGADTFVFTAAAMAGKADRITDFSRKEGDHIDLSGIDAIRATGRNDAFKFMGDKAFSGKAGELHYKVSGTLTVIEADTNGDRKADFSITLNGTHALNAGDFIL